MRDIEIGFYPIVGSSHCMDASDGEKVFKKIKAILDQKNKAVLSFLNVEMLTSAFLNTAVGRLYGYFEYDVIKKSLSVKDISDDDKLLLKKVIDTAKVFYIDKKKKYYTE